MNALMRLDLPTLSPSTMILLLLVPSSNEFYLVPAGLDFGYLVLLFTFLFYFIGMSRALVFEALVLPAQLAVHDPITKSLPFLINTD